MREDWVEQLHTLQKSRRQKCSTHTKHHNIISLAPLDLPSLLTPHPLQRTRSVLTTFGVFLTRYLVSSALTPIMLSPNWMASLANWLVLKFCVVSRGKASPRKVKSDREKISPWRGRLENKVHSNSTYPLMPMKLNPFSLIFAASFFALLPVFTELATQNAGGKNGDSSSRNTFSNKIIIYHTFPTVTDSLSTCTDRITTKAGSNAYFCYYTLMNYAPYTCVYACVSSCTHKLGCLTHAHTVTLNGFWTGSIIENAPTTIQLQYGLSCLCIVHTQHYDLKSNFTENY